MAREISIHRVSELKSTVTVSAVVSVVALLTIQFSRSAADETSVELTRTDLTYISYVEEIFNLSDQLGDSIWPDLDYRRIPMLLYRPDSVAFLFNHPDPPTGFTRIEILPLALKGNVSARPGRFEDYTGQFWPGAIVNDQFTFVCPYDKDDSWESRFFRFVVHEAFHNFQSSSFQDMGDTDEKLYPITLPENNALATLENLILADAVEGLIARDRDEVYRRAREFAIVREYRLERAPPFVQRHERVIERLENTAFYVEKRCDEAGNSRTYRPTGFREYVQFDPYLTHREVLENLKEGILEHLEGGAIGPMAMPRYRIYDNGAATGYILDFLGIDWKRDVMSDSSFLFHRQLMRGLGIPVDERELENEVEEIEKEFDFESILSASRKNVEGYLAEAANLEAQIRSAGEITLRIVMNVKGGMSKSKRSSKRVLYADQGRTTLIEHVDQFLVESANASITVRNSGLIFSRSTDDNTATVLLSIDEMPAVFTVDGQVRRLTEGNCSSDSSLQLELGDILKIQGKSGEVVVDGDSVTVRLE